MSRAPIGPPLLQKLRDWLSRVRGLDTRPAFRNNPFVVSTPKRTVGLNNDQMRKFSDEPAETSISEMADDLEDGEIEDDDEVAEEQPAEQVVEAVATPQVPSAPPPPPIKMQIEQMRSPSEKGDKERPAKDRPKEKRDRRHKDKEPRHMTEAERSILHLRRKERMEREKWNKYRKDQGSETQDDFAIKLEKTMASILKKDRVTSDEDKEDDRRSNKRKKRGKDNERKAKQRKTDSPRSEEVDENEMLNVRGGSPEQGSGRLDKDERLKSPRSEQSYDSENSSEHEEKNSSRNRRENRRENKKSNKNKNKNRDRNFKRDRSRERKTEPVTDGKGVCIFYLNGKCNKNDCIYSHEAIPPMKLELCKFYLMDCCAKGENCSYMHSEFPCKFYHMGLPCNMENNCKFAHGKPLTDGLKQILFKHIETAPRDILGGFPRLNREDMLNMMDTTQKNLIEMYQKPKKSEKPDKSDDTSGDGSIPSLFDIDVQMPSDLKNMPSETKSKSNEKSGRNRPSRWQEADPSDLVSNLGMNFVPFNFTQDQDMRISSNGDVDMRTLPPHPLTSIAQPLPCLLPMGPDSSQLDILNPNKDVDIRNLQLNAINFASDVDVSLPSTFDAPISQKLPEEDAGFLGKQDVDIRCFTLPILQNDEKMTEPSKEKIDLASTLNIPSTLPKMQRELYLRIQAQQRDNQIAEEEPQGSDSNMEPPDISWYSDDDDDDDENRLTIKVDNEDINNREKEEAETEENEDKTEEYDALGKPTYNPVEPAPIRASDVVEKLGDLSKIKITADITKLLSTLSANLPTIAPIESQKEQEKEKRDPRQAQVTSAAVTPPTSRSPVSSPKTTPRADPRTRSAAAESSRDPRRTTVGVPAPKTEKMSIYEQGGIDLGDLDLRIETSEEYKGSTRPDVDLRTLGLPFKGMENYTPATEIDARISSHPPIVWNVYQIEIPRPDYSGLKLSINDAEKTGDPRLRKIFRLSTEEKDTPTSPVTSPRPMTTARIDPRLRKTEDVKPLQFPDSPIMNYNQQLNTLQSSVFYQSLTSNQKLMLNQELASRADQSGSHDPILNSILTNLNLIPPMGNTPNPNIPNQGNNFGIAVNILQSINKMNPMGQNGMIGPNVNPNMMNPNAAMMNPMAQGVIQPGLLGAAPGIPNMQHDFPMNFDPRTQGGLLGSAPQGLLGNGPQFPNFEPQVMQGPAGFQNYQNDDFYPQEQNQGGFRGNQMRNDRGGNFNNRERRRGGRNFARNQGNRNQFRRNQGGGNRSMRAHTPP